MAIYSLLNRKIARPSLGIIRRPTRAQILRPTNRKGTQLPILCDNSQRLAAQILHRKRNAREAPDEEIKLLRGGRRKTAGSGGRFPRKRDDTLHHALVPVLIALFPVNPRKIFVLPCRRGEFEQFETALPTGRVAKELGTVVKDFCGFGFEKGVKRVVEGDVVGDAGGDDAVGGFGVEEGLDFEVFVVCLCRRGSGEGC